ncbi:hypothetical protein [Mycobacterium sp. JS623]|uniref:hypothetical protein n=1 Tax=Mycobacterium sp. JS623 TaxID=212767 RepID=UPI001E4EC070|nr:hypothetical protein [Mycobacterium sp. JS623]
MTCLLYAASPHEREVMESATLWVGKTTRSHQSYAAGLDDKTTGRQFGNALEAAELLPRNTSEARLIPRGQPGQMVELIDFDEVVVYLDELRGARVCAARDYEPAGM